MRRLTRESDGVLLAEVELADDFLARLRGLMFKAALPPQGGLWLEPCSSIHMLFMRFPIDVVFARPLAPDQLEVLAIRPRVRPWTGMAACSGARVALELPAGRSEELELQVGQRLAVAGREGVAA